MSTEDLILPRYKVIASDTSGNVIQGDILTYDDECGLFWVRGEPFGEERLKEFPHLFKPLQ